MRRAGLDEQRGGTATRSHEDSPSRPHEDAQCPQLPQHHQQQVRRRRPSPRVPSGGTSPLVPMVLLTLLLWCLGSSFLLFYGSLSSDEVVRGGVLVLPERMMAARRAADPFLRGRSERLVWDQMKATLERRFVLAPRQQQQQRVATTTADEHRALSEGNRQELYRTSTAPLTDTRLLQSIQGASIRSSTESSSCMLPLATSRACQATHFAVLAVVWESNDSPNNVPENTAWHRTMFLNCLQWMAVPSVSDIYILLPDSQQQSLLQENASYYGHRILHWHQQPNHPVHLVFGTSLGGALSQLPQPPPSAAVLWTTANKEFRGNAKGLQQGFAQWKRQPAVPVSAAVWQFQYYYRKHGLEQQQHAVMIHNSHHNRTVSRSSSRHNNNIPSIPEDDNLVPLPALRLVSATTANQTIAYDVPDDKYLIPLHSARLPVWFELSVATFHDWNYICFLLKHRNALDPLWQILDDTNNNWKAARWALEAWLSLVVPTDHRKVKESSADTRQLHNVRFFDLHRSSSSGSSAGATITNEASNRNTIASPVQVLALDEDMRDIVSLFGGMPPVADETVVSLVSSRRQEDYDVVDRIV